MLKLIMVKQGYENTKDEPCIGTMYQGKYQTLISDGSVLAQLP